MQLLTSDIAKKGNHYHYMVQTTCYWGDHTASLANIIIIYSNFTQHENIDMKHDSGDVL